MSAPSTIMLTGDLVDMGGRNWKNVTASEIIADLMKMYGILASLPPPPPCVPDPHHVRLRRNLTPPLPPPAV